MKQVVLFLTVAFGLLILDGRNNTAQGQNTQGAGAYMDQMSMAYQQISQDMWDYTRAVAHGKSAKKVESRRKEVVKSLLGGQKTVGKLPPFEGDASLRDSVVSYLKMCYYVINNDFGKLVDMEEIAEQSYDAMEAYLLAQKMANDKLDVANDQLVAQQRAFASNHNVNLVEDKSDLAQKLEKASKVFDYYNIVYLIFFKSYKQEAYLLDAQGKNDLNAVEQNKSALYKFSEEGLAKLDTMKSFNGDMSAINSCKKILTFYKNEASDKSSAYADMQVKKEKYEKLKAAYDAKMERLRTQQDVDQLNKAVAEYNQAVNDYNANIQLLNKTRSKELDGWNNAIQDFLSRHTPKKK